MESEEKIKMLDNEIKHLERQSSTGTSLNFSLSSL